MVVHLARLASEICMALRIKRLITQIIIMIVQDWDYTTLLRVYTRHWYSCGIIHASGFGSSSGWLQCMNEIVLVATLIGGANFIHIILWGTNEPNRLAPNHIRVAECVCVPEPVSLCAAGDDEWIYFNQT